MEPAKYDFIIIGSGIIGLSIALNLRKQRPMARILLLDKEEDIASHSSGRNSGVLHAGFYYTADSFKAKFTVLGNKTMKQYCREKGIPVNECGKLVVAQNAAELEKLYELEARGKKNGSNVWLVDAAQAKEYEPNVRTYRQALYSPDTASIDPKQVCQTLKADLVDLGVDLKLQTKYLSRQGQVIKTTQGDFESPKLINCAGLYADHIARDFGYGLNYTMIPFKGLYLKYTKNKTDVRINIYPVPNLRNPFLGVHFTKTVHDEIKIGPTAIPAFWRENYTSFAKFSLAELAEIAFYETKLFTLNSFGFRDLAFEEILKYNRKYFIGLAQKMVDNIDPAGFTEFTAPGMRAQLLDKRRLELVQDFVIEGDRHSTHVLNAVSPAFTCAFPFADFVIQNYVLNA